MGNLISLSVVTRNSKPVNDTWLIDTENIAGPSPASVSGGTDLRVNENASDTTVKHNTLAVVTLNVSESPAAVSALSDDLFYATVESFGTGTGDIKRTILDTPTDYLFAVENVEGPIKPYGTGSEFTYRDQGNPRPVIYRVSQTPAQIMNQVNANVDIYYSTTCLIDSTRGDDATGLRESWRRPFRTVQGALAGANAGDVIHFLPGQHTVNANVLFQGNNLYFVEFGALVDVTVPQIGSGSDKITMLGQGVVSMKGVTLNDTSQFYLECETYALYRDPFSMSPAANILNSGSQFAIKATEISYADSKLIDASNLDLQSNLNVKLSCDVMISLDTGAASSSRLIDIISSNGGGVVNVDINIGRFTNLLTRTASYFHFENADGVSAVNGTLTIGGDTTYTGNMTSASEAIYMFKSASFDLNTKSSSTGEDTTMIIAANPAGAPCQVNVSGKYYCSSDTTPSIAIAGQNVVVVLTSDCYVHHSGVNLAAISLGPTLAPYSAGYGVLYANGSIVHAGATSGVLLFKNIEIVDPANSKLYIAGGTRMIITNYLLGAECVTAAAPNVYQSTGIAIATAPANGNCTSLTAATAIVDNTSFNSSML